MNEKVQLYTFVRTGPSIYLARVERIDVRTGIPGQQNLSLQMRIEQTLWGQSGEPIRRSEFTQPESEFARLKYPHPIWRHVSMRQDVRVFLVTHELSGVPANPLYVEEVAEPDDPVLIAVRAVLEQEQTEQDEKRRFTRYLHYLTDGPTVSKLFGAEALAKDTDLSDVDREGKIASAMAATFISDLAIYVRLSMGTLMWQRIYSRTNSIGKIAILNATIKGVEDPSEDISRFSIDHLMMAEPAALAQAGVKKSSEAVRLLQEQLGFETSADVRAHSQQLIDALRSQL
jgi:hypothetical protein